MNQDLTDLLQKKQQQSSANTPIDWDDRRNRYLAAVQALFQQIETVLAAPIGQKTVMCQRRPKSLTESFIGTYSTDDLILIIGDEQVRFSPRGRNVAGAAGRVDVIGERGEATLLLLPDSEWGFVRSRQPTLLVEPFNENALGEVLRLVMRD